MKLRELFEFYGSTMKSSMNRRKRVEKKKTKATTTEIDNRTKKTKSSCRGLGRRTFNETDPDVIVFIVKGMCKTLDFDGYWIWKEVKRKVREEHFWPFVDLNRNKHGLALRHPDGTFVLMPYSVRRAILHGLKKRLRPRKMMPKGNRVVVTDEKRGEVSVCYWPDDHLEKCDRNKEKRIETNNNKTSQ